MFYQVELLYELLLVRVFENPSVHRWGEEQHVNCWMLCSRRTFWPMWRIGGKIDRIVTPSGSIVAGGWIVVVIPEADL